MKASVKKITNDKTGAVGSKYGLIEALESATAIVALRAGGTSLTTRFTNVAATPTGAIGDGGG